MQKTVTAALQAGVSLGAHPSYPDLQGFGRRALKCSAEEVEAFVLYQLGALDGFARANGARVTHVKPHGALSNEACRNAELAGAIARAIKAYDARTILLAPALSALADAGARENICDRARNLRRPRLRGRRPAHAARGRAARCCTIRNKALRMSKPCSPPAASKPAPEKFFPRPIHSICVHGDGPEAVATARALNARLSKTFTLAPLPSLFASHPRARFSSREFEGEAMSPAVQSRAERIEPGKALRKQTPRAAHGRVLGPFQRDANAILEGQERAPVAVAGRAAPRADERRSLRLFARRGGGDGA